MDGQEEFLKLFLKHQTGIKAFILATVRDRQAAEDVLQEVALTLWKSFNRYDPERSFGAWARGIAAKKILQSAGEKTRPITLSSEAIDAIALAYDKAEAGIPREVEALNSCMDQLPAKSRQLLALRYEQSRKLADLARDLSSTIDAVSKTLSRIRIGLQKCIEQRLRAN